MRNSNLPNPEYEEAFRNYLKYGITITVPYYTKDIEIKSAEKYIWRTSDDVKVRISHQQNNGKIFSYDDHLETGHPGEDYNCRCMAETYIEGVSEYANQTLTTIINDSGKKWSNYSFVEYFYKGRGKATTLSETGFLRKTINYYFYDLNVINRLNNQIIHEARKIISNKKFIYEFYNYYDFYSHYKPWRGIKFSFGGGVVEGKFNGTVRKYRDMIKINGKIKFKYIDEFTDPTNIREKLWPGTSDPAATNSAWRLFSDIGGTAYAITDSWETDFRAEVKIDGNVSIYNLEN